MPFASGDARPYKLEVDGEEVGAFTTVEDAQEAERLLIAAGETSTDIISGQPTRSAFTQPDAEVDWERLLQREPARHRLVRGAPADDNDEYMRHGWFRDQAGKDAEGEVKRKPAPKKRPAKKPAKKRPAKPVAKRRK